MLAVIVHSLLAELNQVREELSLINGYHLQKMGGAWTRTGSCRRNMPWQRQDAQDLLVGEDLCPLCRGACVLRMQDNKFMQTNLHRIPMPPLNMPLSTHLNLVPAEAHVCLELSQAVEGQAAHAAATMCHDPVVTVAGVLAGLDADEGATSINLTQLQRKQNRQ